jgi:hypothetical protein
MSAVTRDNSINRPTDQGAETEQYRCSLNSQEAISHGADVLEEDVSESRHKKWSTSMKLTTQLNPQHHSRRFLLKSGATALFSFAIPPSNNAFPDQSLATANGSTDPYPIPWLDKNGSHNQPAGPNLEPSHIYHFKGRVARCSTFTGMGTDNRGNRIAFGAPTTDYGVMQGEYWAARAAQQGTFTHI